MKEHTVSCLNLEQIQVTTVCRQFSEFIYVSGSPKTSQSSFGKYLKLLVMRHLIYIIFLDKDTVKSSRPLGLEEEVVPRFTLGLQSRPRRHLVPLPWQLDQCAPKDTSNSTCKQLINLYYKLVIKKTRSTKNGFKFPR